MWTRILASHQTLCGIIMVKLIKYKSPILVKRSRLAKYKSDKNSPRNLKESRLLNILFKSKEFNCNG